MSSLVYTNQRSKLSKKQRAAREALLKEQRAIKRELKASQTNNSSGLESTTTYYRDTPRIASRDTGLGVAVMRAAPVYTGDKMIGIGQMHKSNAVPVFRQEEAQELASMRR